jgi:hypothetical protein
MQHCVCLELLQKSLYLRIEFTNQWKLSFLRVAANERRTLPPWLNKTPQLGNYSSYSPRQECVSDWD